MGSSPNPSPAHPTRELEAAHGHQAREQRITGAQATTRGPEQPSTDSTPSSASPPTPTTPTDDKPCRTERRPWPWAAGSPSPASRENDANPVMWLAGQDYRAADATRTARLAVTRSRHGPERLSPER